MTKTTYFRDINLGEIFQHKSMQFKKVDLRTALPLNQDYGRTQFSKIQKVERMQYEN
jgi:hypothetical protein